MTYTISKYEEIDGRLFIKIDGPTTFIEHYFHEDEKKHLARAIEALIAELEVKEEDLATPEKPTANKMQDLANINIDQGKVELAKERLLEEITK